MLTHLEQILEDDFFEKNERYFTFLATPFPLHIFVDRLFDVFYNTKEIKLTDADKMEHQFDFNRSIDKPGSSCFKKFVVRNFSLGYLDALNRFDSVFTTKVVVDGNSSKEKLSFYFFHNIFVK